MTKSIFDKENFSSDDTKECLVCGKLIKIKAKKCHYCFEFIEGHTFESVLNNEVIHNLGKVAQEGIKKCPFCSEEVKAYSKKCPYCREFFEGHTSESIRDNIDIFNSVGDSTETSPNVHPPSNILRNGSFTSEARYWQRRCGDWRVYSSNDTDDLACPGHDFFLAANDADRIYATPSVYQDISMNIARDRRIFNFEVMLRTRVPRVAVLAIWQWYTRQWETGQVTTEGPFLLSRVEMTLNDEWKQYYLSGESKAKSNSSIRFEIYWKDNDNSSILICNARAFTS